MRVSAAFVAAVLFVGCGERTPPTTAEATVSPNEVYHNPADGKSYVAPGGWKTYYPETTRQDEPGRKVKTDHIRLLTSDADMKSRITTADAAKFIREAERLAESSLGNSGREFRVVVQFHCTPDGHAVKLAHQGDSTQELLQSLYDALVAADKMPVNEGEFVFQLELSVSP